MYRSNSNYSPVDKPEEEEGLIIAQTFQVSEPVEPLRKAKQPRGRPWPRSFVWFIHGSLIFIQIAVLFSFWIHAPSAMSKFPVYSPANVAVEYKEELTVFNGSLDHPSIYSGYPNPDLDAAWLVIAEESIAPLRLSPEELEMVGRKDTPSKVRIPDQYGGGFVAQLEYNHHLHCLNMLRKFTYREYYEKFDPIFLHAKSPEMVRKHLDHCVEILRQAIMCSADVSIITYEWVVGYKRPYPDFNTKHQCRDIEKIIAWKKENSVQIPENEVRRPGPAEELALPPS